MKMQRFACLGVTAALALAGAACGAGQSPTASATAARTSQYSCPFDQVFDAATQSMEQEFKTLASKDKAQAAIISTPRWHDKDGMSRREGVATSELKNGDLALAVRVRIVDLKPNFQIQVDAVVKQYTSGSPQPRDVPEGDPQRPAWVQGRLDKVAADIHGRLESCAALVREPH
ncbi:MAG TPA: hypothetical protein VK698_18550 [Kofleriaceae bacterium]|nr:hypothetical protein [Kofleriaceae bacterium]